MLFGKKKKIEEPVKIPLRMQVHNLVKEHWTSEPELAPMLMAVLQFEFAVRKKQEALMQPPAQKFENNMEELMGKLN